MEKEFHAQAIIGHNGTGGDSMETLLESTKEFQVVPLPSISGYEVLEEIGRGGMGVVYKARQKKLGRLVALKILLPEFAQSSDKLARFQIEASAVARLQHPHMVQVFEVGEFEGRPFISLELVEGGDLADKLGKPWTPESAVRLVEQLARAIDYAHERGIVHRDLKPANILIQGSDVRGQKSEDGSQKSKADYFPKIADFGLAKLLDGESTDKAIGWQTQVGIVLGSPPYMAPEQAAGRVHEIGPATDIHALGMILYELLTARPPFRGNTVLETLEQVKFQQPIAPSAIIPEIDAKLDAICLKCLEKNPRRRFASAANLADDLCQYLKSLGNRNQPAIPSVSNQARRPTVVALQVILAVVSTLGSGLTVWQVFRAENAPRPDMEGVSEIRSPSEPGALATGRFPAPSRSRDLLDDLNCQTSLSTLQFAFPHPGPVEFVGFGPTGKTAYTLCHVRSSAADQFTEVRLWDLSTGQQIGEPMIQKGLVSKSALSPDGRTMVLAGPGNLAWLWDVQARKPIGQPLSHEKEITCLAVSGDNQLVLTGSADHAAHFWSAKNGQPIGSPLLHPGAISTVTFSRDSRLAATASQDGTLRLWDTVTGQSKGFQMRHEGPVNALAFSSNGNMLLTGGDDRCARLWDPATGRPIGKPLVHLDRVLAVAFSPDGSRIATGSADRTARVWETSLDQQELSFPHQSAVKSVEFRPDGQMLLTTSLDFKAQLWNLATGKRVGSTLSRPEKVITAVFSPDGKRILTGSQEGSAKLWEIGGGSQTFPPPELMVNIAVHSRDK